MTRIDGGLGRVGLVVLVWAAMTCSAHAVSPAPWSAAPAPAQALIEDAPDGEAEGEPAAEADDNGNAQADGQEALAPNEAETGEGGEARTPLIDPETGEQMVDPETGDLLFETSVEGEGGEGEGGEAAPAGPIAKVKEFADAGGPIIYILLALSILSLAIVAVKLLQFWLGRVGARGFVAKAAEKLRVGDHDGALAAIGGRNNPVAAVMRAAIKGKAMGAKDEVIREEVERIAQARLDGLETGLPFLSLIATVSPLLGLLGTVLGMIEAFQQLQVAGDRVDPAILSGGIWEALLTTAAGLSVAIPAAAFYVWLQRTVEVVGQRMEDAGAQVFTIALYAGGTKQSA